MQCAHRCPARRSSGHDSVRANTRSCKVGRNQGVVCRSNSDKGRRGILLLGGTAGLSLLLQRPTWAGEGSAATVNLDSYTPMDALKGKDYGKSRLTYSDFQVSPLGVQYKDFRDGSGEPPKAGDTCVVDWAGVTIGYYGRPFEARNKPKGSSFSDDNKEFLRFKLGSGALIPAFEEAVSSMRPGGIRRIVVPEELGYPDYDWRKQGPGPSTFAGQRALDFVLSNKGMIDKTLLFDIELVRVDRASS